MLRREKAAFEMDRKGTDLNMGARRALHTQGTREPRREARKWGERRKTA